MDDFHDSIYFGPATRDDVTSLGFSQLARRLVAGMHVFERILALPYECRRSLALYYEEQLHLARHNVASAASPRRSLRETLMGGFLDVKGESVLASINAFELLRRSSTGAAPFAQHASNELEVEHGLPRDVPSLSQLLNDIMSVNIFEAVISNLSFAFWPDNARAGMALLLRNGAPFRSDLTQALDFEWYSLYLAWNANFIWPSHYMKDMMCFTMLLTPTIALDGPATFAYNRAHTLLWVVRSAQLTRLRDERARATAPQQDQSAPAPCFRCRGAPLPHDRQPLTTRMAKLTRASGEQLAAAAGDDVSGNMVWWQLATQVAPRELARAWQLYVRMPKASPTKFRLL